jgi:ABC-type antimicrobial peptide transport system ATPase subunit
MLEVNALKKSYGKVIAVDGVNLRAGAGETAALLGQNGAGRTTTVSARSSDERVFRFTDPSHPSLQPSLLRLPDNNFRIGVKAGVWKSLPPLRVPN